MTSENIIEANELNFDYEVISFSKNTPVLVDFWAEWCQPCKIIGPMLEKIVSESGSNLRLAKVNIDANPNLAIQYNVRSIPTIKAFIDGHVVSEFVGVLPEVKIREFIAKLVPPSPVDLDLEKGLNMLLSHSWEWAEKVLRNVLVQKPESNAARLGCGIALLGLGKPKEAIELLSEITAGRELARKELVLPFAVALKRFQDDDLPNDTDLDTIFKHSLEMAAQGKFAIALDGLLDILRQDKQYRNKLAHQVVLGILEIMGVEDPQTREYRSELASILF